MGSIGNTVLNTVTFGMAGDSSQNPLFNGSMGKNLGQGQFEAGQYNIDGAAFNPNAQETSFTQALEARANGTGGPSVAQQQMQAGADLATQNATGMAAAARGINPAMAARQAQMASAQMQGQTNQQAGQLRAAEQMEAGKQFGAMLQSQREARMGKEALGVQQQQGMNNVNAAGFEGSQNRRSNLIGGLAQGAMSAATSMLGMNQGGVVPRMATGGMVTGSFAEGLRNLEGLNGQAMSMIHPQKLNEFGTDKPKKDANEDLVLGRPTMMAGGEMDAGGLSELNGDSLTMMASQGAMVPGKAEVAGDSLKNDTVPTMLSPGEMVIPRTVVQGGAKAVASFAEALLKKESKNGKVA